MIFQTLDFLFTKTLDLLAYPFVRPGELRQEKKEKENKQLIIDLINKDNKKSGQFKFNGEPVEFTIDDIWYDHMTQVIRLKKEFDGEHIHLMVSGEELLRLQKNFTIND